MTPVLKPNWNMPKTAEKIAKIKKGGSSPPPSEPEVDMTILCFVTSS